MSVLQPVRAPRRRRRSRSVTVPLLAACLGAVMAVSGCGGDSLSVPAEGSVDVEITLTGDQAETPEARVPVAVGQSVEIRVDSDTAGELGVHADPEIYFDVEPGEQVFEVTLDRPGIVAVETHQPTEQLILELQVQ